MTNLDEEVLEDDVYDVFSNYGQIKSLHLHFDRRTGMAKGYALIGFAQSEEAEEAISSMNGQPINNKAVKVDWAFKTAPIQSKA